MRHGRKISNSIIKLFFVVVYPLIIYPGSLNTHLYIRKNQAKYKSSRYNVQLLQKIFDRIERYTRFVIVKIE